MLLSFVHYKRCDVVSELLYVYCEHYASGLTYHCVQSKDESIYSFFSFRVKKKNVQKSYRTVKKPKQREKRNTGAITEANVESVLQNNNGYVTDSLISRSTLNLIFFIFYYSLKLPKKTITNQSSGFPLKNFRDRVKEGAHWKNSNE